MSETQLADRILETMKAWGESIRDVRALWLTGSFATGVADRFSDIDLRGCTESEDFDYFRSVERALSGLDDWHVMNRRRFSEHRTDSELVIVFLEGLTLDFHVVTLDRLNAAYVGPYPIRVLFDAGCSLTELHAAARREHAAREPADQKTRISRAVVAWDFLAHALAETMRGKHAYALSLLEGARAALAQVLLGRTEPIPARFGPVSLPKYLPPEDQQIVDATVSHRVIGSIPDTIKRLAAALKSATAELEQRDGTGRLARMRVSVESLIQRELANCKHRPGPREQPRGD